MQSITPSRLALGAAMAGLAFAAPAGAHGIAAGGLAGGLLHPLTGLDHLVMLMAVGTAAAMIGSRLLAWALGGALVGAALASTGVTLPAAEVLAALAIAAVALLTLLAAGRQQDGPGLQLASLAAPAVALGVAVHAMLHGLEAPRDGSTLLWWIGAFTSSVVLSGGSFVLLRRRPALRAAAAAAFLLVGGCLTLAALISQVHAVPA
jgi:urease accessory protein